MTSKKQRILEAATLLFAEKGFNDTSIAELARTTNTAQGTIFYHFKNKAMLLVAVLADVKRGINQEFENFVINHSFSNGREMVEGIIAFLIYLANQNEQWLLLLHRLFPYEFARRDDGCRIQLEAIFNTLIDLFEGGIRRGQADGSIRELNPRKTALVLFSLVNGLIWLKFHDLYDSGTLHRELLISCQRILTGGDDRDHGDS